MTWKFSSSILDFRFWFFFAYIRHFLGTVFRASTFSSFYYASLVALDHFDILEFQVHKWYFTIFIF